MISYLTGKIVLERPTFIVVEVGGVGYKVSIIPKIDLKIGQNIKVYTYQHIREDVSDLYGFQSYEELELFREAAFRKWSWT